MQGRKGDDEIRGKMAELVMVCDKESEIRQQRLQNATLSLRKSLRSSKSNADQTISINDMARAFFSGHNYQINLTEGQDGTEHYQQMFAFLRQSRIAHVLSHAPVICEPYLMEFWENARYIKRADDEVIVSRVANNDIEFTAEDLRIILNLGSVAQEGGAGGLTVFDRSIIAGGLRRMGFAGEMAKSTLFKKGFFGRWRYLAHVLLVGLSNKKTGWDTLNQETQAQMVGIVYNKPYSFSKFFFNEFRKQISVRGTTRFLMYPRFVAMILNDRLPNLPVVEPVRRVTTLIKRSYNEFITRNANDPNAQDVELFGAIIDINYATPSDEAIASFEDLPLAQPQPQQQQQQQQPQPQQQQQQPQPLPQPEVAAQQINVMLDEQAANPPLAQAVIHDALQEHAPIDDPFADIEAYHDAGVPEDEAHEDAPVATGSRGVGDQDDRGKGAVGEGDKTVEVDDSATSSDDSSDDDEDGDDEGERTRVVQIGSKVVSRGGSSVGMKRREADTDYPPEVGESSEPPQAKKARTTEGVSSTVVRPVPERPSPYQMRDAVPRPIPTQSSTPSLPATPFQFQINDLNNKLRVMEGSVRALAAELKNQKKNHEKEINDQWAKYNKDMGLMKTRIDRLSAELEKEKVKGNERFEDLVSEVAEEVGSRVTKADLEGMFEEFLMKRGLITDLSCKGDDPEDDILEQVEAYRGDDDLLALVDAYKGDDSDDASAPRDSGKDIDMGGAGGTHDREATVSDDGDSDIDDDEGKRDSVTVRKGSKVKSATVSDPHPESSSPIKRKAADLNYVRTKRVRRSGGVVISEPIAIETTTPTATSTATPEFTASMATEMPSSSIPSSSVPVFQVPDVLQRSELEGKFLILTARVNSLSSQWATQNVQHSEQVASLNKQVESSHQRVNSLEEEVEMLRRETVTQRRLNISQKERIGVLEAQCKNQSDFFQRLASQQQLQAGLLESVLQILGTQREKSSCKGSLPKITSNPQETIISMSAPFSSVSTDGGSSAKDDHSRQANRVGRKLRNVQGIQSSVLSPGSASSLRRSPRFKVKK